MATLSLIRQKAIKINDRIWGEEVKVAFLVDGMLDKERREMRVVGVLRSAQQQTKKPDGGMGTAWRVPFSAVPACLSINRNTYPSLVIKQGDKVQALSREGQPWFQVTSVNDRSHHRLYIYLSEA